MDCTQAHPHLLDLQRGRLADPLAAEIQAHVAGCADCTRLAEAESALTEALERRLPQHPAPLALKRRLREQWPAPAVPPRRRWELRRLAWAAALAVVVLVVGLVGWDQAVRRPERDVAARLVGEAVNDHLRLLFSQQPLEVRASGIHQVRPWFAGRLDFAPVVRFGGDEQFPLQGGTVGYYLDRKAAIVVYHHGLHVMTLVIFRSDGLPWPRIGDEPLAGIQARPDSARGFNVLLWRQGELGYALVSDAEPAALRALAGRLIAGG
jgi:anti-sigma factor RsiW